MDVDKIMLEKIMTTEEYYLSLPPGTHLSFKDTEVVLLNYNSSYDGIDEYTVCNIQTGNIEHISKYLFFEQGVDVLKCADGTYRSEYIYLIESNKHKEPEAIRLRSLLESHLGKTHHIILGFDTLIRFREFQRKVKENNETQPTAND